MEHRLATIVAADIVGYSRLVSVDEVGVISRFKALRDHVIGPKITSCGGRVIKLMGDGMLAEFPSPETALHCALDVQLAVARSEAEVPDDRRLFFRIGINHGKVILDDDDVLGDVVNIAARLESLASPGGICISQMACDQMPDPQGIELAPLGPQFVKNIPTPIEVWHVLIDGVAAPATTPTERGARPSIAVLAFENGSTDPEQGFLADGIAEDVVTQLSRFRSLFVIGRNSSFSYRGTQEHPAQIGKELGVRYLVSGSVRRGGDRLRVSASLTEAATGVQLWSNKWDRSMSDLFAVQDELTRSIVSQIVPELGTHERHLARRKPTESLNAWELCQRGIADYSLFTAEGHAAAREHYRAAAEADPQYALPRALMARWHTTRVVTGRSKDVPSDLQHAFAHATAAIQLDDRLEEGHVVLGIVFGMMQRPEEAFQALDRAFALNDNNAAMFYARTYACLFQPEIETEGMREAALAAIEINPKDPVAWAFHFMLGTALWNRDLTVVDAETKQAFDTACSFANAEFFALLITAVFYIRQGDNAGGKSLLDRALRRQPDLSLAKFRTIFPFPAWPRMVAAIEPELKVLVELGLPEA